MRLCIIDRDFADAVASLSQSGQMDTAERSWAALCARMSSAIGERTKKLGAMLLANSRDGGEGDE